MTFDPWPLHEKHIVFAVVVDEVADVEGDDEAEHDMMFLASVDDGCKTLIYEDAVNQRSLAALLRPLSLYTTIHVG